MATGWTVAGNHQGSRRHVASSYEARSAADHAYQQHEKAGRYEPAGPDPYLPAQPQVPQVPQRMLVLMGLPGSGKTTLAMRLRQMGWVWINQDVMGDRNTCVFECTQALLAGREVVIDRCNFDAQQRSNWTRIANQGSHLGKVYVIALHLQVPAEECKRRAAGRMDHPTLNGDTVTEVIDRFDTQFQRVQKYEHFDENYRAQSQYDIDNFEQYVGTAFFHPPHFSPHPINPTTGMPDRVGKAVPASTPLHNFDNAIPRQHTGLQQRPAGPSGQEASQQPYQPQQQQHQQQSQPQASQPHAQQQQPQQQLHQQPSSLQQQQQQQQEPLPWDTSEQSAQPQHKKKKKKKRQQPPQQQEHQSPLQSNIVPFHNRKSTLLSAERGPGSIPAKFLDDDPGSTDKRPIMLFDLNGTLTSHTAARRSSGKTLIRPGTHHLRRLQEHFRLGIFTSASMRTTRDVIPMLEAAAGRGPPLFGDQSLILYRDHTELAPEEHVLEGGEMWDTIKPLHKWFKHLHRVLLMDDDAYKAVPEEEGNMIVVRCWDDKEPEDMHLGMVADLLLANYSGLDETTDVRLKSKAVSDALEAAVADNMMSAAANGAPAYEPVTSEYRRVSPPA